MFGFYRLLDFIGLIGYFIKMIICVFYGKLCCIYVVSI